MKVSIEKNLEYIKNSIEIDKFDYALQQNAKFQTVIITTNLFLFFGGFILGKELYGLFTQIFWIWILAMLLISFIYNWLIFYPIKKEFLSKREILKEEYQKIGVNVKDIQKRFEEKNYQKSFKYKFLKYLRVKEYLKNDKDKK